MAETLITASEPRILTRTGLILNPSFELGSVGSLPTNWTKGGVGGNTATKELTQFFDRGNGASAFACEFERTAASNLNLTSDKTAAGVVVLNQPWCFCCAVYPVGPSQPDFGIRIDTFDASDVQQDTNTDSSSSGWTIGAWNFCQVQLTPVAATATKFSVLINLNNLPLNEKLYVDYCHFGLASDFDRRFSKWKPKGKPRGTLATGDGAYEAVRLGDPLEKVQFGFPRMHEGQTRELAWIQFMKEATNYQPFTIWRERNNWLNLDGHYETLIASGEYSFDYQPGMPRYAADITAEAPLERRLNRDTAQ